MDHKVDLIIVGGGPAGLSTALHLVHHDPSLQGRIVVLEKSRYPRDKICGGAIAARAEHALAEIGVHVDVPSAPFTRMSVDILSGSHVARAGGTQLGRVVRRIEFDHALARVARERGIRIEEGVKVNALHVDALGVTLDTSTGPWRARAVVGADGVAGVARKYVTDATATWRAQVLEVDTPAVPGDRPRDVVHFDLSDPTLAGYAWDFPTVVDGEPLMCRGVYHLLMPGASAGDVDLEARLAARLEAIGLDLGACKKKRFAERGFAPHEPMAKPRVLLVGEAAGIDPITGEGIAQALLYGKTAAPYLSARLARDELSFADWPRAFAGSALGVDLRVRHALCRTVFGPSRAFYDAWVGKTPAVAELAACYFGGSTVSKLALARLGLGALTHLALHGLGQRPFRRVALAAPSSPRALPARAPAHDVLRPGP